MDRAGALIEQACRSSGLDRLGDDAYREGLDRLVRSLDGEARLNEVGRAATDAMIVNLLTQRLQIEDWYARHPEIDGSDIVAPLIQLGLPRTGSTALGCLLGQDPDSRSFLMWESLQPCPPPDAATIASDPRIAVAEAMMARRARLFPRMAAMVPSAPTSPTEDQNVMAYDFKSQIFQSFAHIPSYFEWLHHEADLVPTYRYLKRVFKLLQWRAPTHRWRWRNPSHSVFIDALDTVFPDARFVMTHRDVAQVIPSVSDLYYELHKPYSDHVDKHAIARTTGGWCELAMRRMIAFRDGGAEGRFFDIHFAPFQADPIAAIRALYRWLGEPLTDETLARMAHWRATTPRDEGYARSDMASFGLEPAALRARFRFYTERFPAPALHRGTSP